jgi:hypothetical protein
MKEYSRDIRERGPVGEPEASSEYFSQDAEQRLRKKAPPVRAGLRLADERVKADSFL